MEQWGSGRGMEEKTWEGVLREGKGNENLGIEKGVGKSELGKGGGGGGGRS